jgi:hypothetical protein
MGKTLKSFAEWRRQENLYEYNFYAQQLELYCMSMFKWTGLPDGISPRFLERSLYYNGFVIFMKSKKLSAYVVGNASAIGLNDYEEPTAFRVKGVNKLNEIVRASECVVIQNNVLRQGNVSNVNFFAKELSNIKKTFDMNLEQLKHPYILECADGQVSTVQSIMTSKQNGEPYIIARPKTMEGINVATIDLKVQNYTKELIEVMNNFESKAKTHFGINNQNIFKRERLVSDETNQNNEEVELNRKLMLDCRKEACKEINTKFPELNVDVEFVLDTDIGGDIDVE